MIRSRHMTTAELIHNRVTTRMTRNPFVQPCRMHGLILLLAALVTLGPSAARQPEPGIDAERTAQFVYKLHPVRRVATRCVSNLDRAVPGANTWSRPV